MISMEVEDDSGYGMIQKTFKNIYYKTYILKLLNTLHTIIDGNI